MVISSLMPLVYENYHTSWEIRHSPERDPHFTCGCKSSLELLLPAISDVVVFFCILTFEYVG